jgi:hypothetical protein
MGPPLAITLETTVNAFVLAFVGGMAAVVVTSIVGFIRHLRKVDSTVRDLNRRQRHLLRWAQRAGRKVDLPFPLDDADLFDQDEEEEG